MTGSIVPPQLDRGTAAGAIQPLPAPGSSPREDLLSDVLARMNPEVYVSGGLRVPGEMAVSFPRHQGIKCYAMLAGHCWLAVDEVAEPVRIEAGDCFLLPRGLAFRLATDLELEPVPYLEVRARLNLNGEIPEGSRYIAGGHFSLTGGYAEMLLHSLPPIVHIRRESDRAAMRWSLERLREELNNPQPGGLLITRQLAYMMLIQALRLHLAEQAGAGRGWLAALSDRQMGLAIASMHREPGYPWTLQSLAVRVGMSRSVFALRFRDIVGATPLEYLTRWRMLLAAERLKSSSEGLAEIARSLGYESESAFGKAFRRVMGASPRQFARAARSAAHGADGVRDLEQELAAAG